MEKMKKTTLEVHAARLALKGGWRNAASVVKTIYHTTYYHVCSLTDVIQAGRWIPAPKVSMMPWHGRYGVRTLPPHTILRQDMLDLAR